MAVAIINGRRVSIPENPTTEQIRAAGGIKPGRSLIHRTREGNFVIPSGSKLSVKDGDTFVDAPARIKG